MTQNLMILVPNFSIGAVETTQTKVNKSKLTTNSQEKRLPQTNETQTNANSLGILGLFVAALLSLFGISFKKRRQ